MQPSVSEQLAVLTALQNIIKERLNEIRGEADAELLGSYADDGVVKKALKLGGVKVGDFMVVLTKDEWRIEDREAFEDFALTYGFAEIRKTIRPEYMARAISILEAEAPEALTETVELAKDWQKLITNRVGVAVYLDSGMPVPGLVYEGPHVKCTQVRGCKPETVVPIMQQLGGLDRLLLGAPNDSDTTKQ